MKFLTPLLTFCLAWSAAAGVVQERAAAKKTTLSSATTGKVNAKVTSCQSALLTAQKEGLPSFSIPALPKAGVKVSARSISSEYNDAILRRQNKQPGMDEVVVGTAQDSIEIDGLGPCTGIIVIFDNVSAGKDNKIGAHIGPREGARTIQELTRQIYTAAVEGGAWDINLDAGHQPHIYVNYPEVSAEIASMVNEGTIQSTASTGLTNTLTKLNNDIQTAIETLCTQLNGRCYVRSRTTARVMGSTMRAETNGRVTIDGVAI